MIKETTPIEERTMINSDKKTRDNLKLAAAKLKLPMNRLLSALTAYALTLEHISEIQPVNHQTQEP